MTPDEVSEIFTNATASYETVTSKPTYTDIGKFDEKINSILVELQRDYDGDEYGLLYLGQEASNYNSITESSLTKIEK